MKRMLCSCPAPECSGDAYMVITSVAIYNDATVVVCKTMCPHCHQIGVMEVSLADQLAKIVFLADMEKWEIQLMIDVWES